MYLVCVKFNNIKQEKIGMRVGVKGGWGVGADVQIVVHPGILVARNY